jgi:hypothetical protein
MDASIWRRSPNSASFSTRRVDRGALIAAARDHDHAVHLPALQALATWWPDDAETVATPHLARPAWRHEEQAADSSTDRS